ncbi:MAG TPA: ABC transporter [Firmicutes bacterium]|nr:ABC transporter [Bacillota bacterium]
MLKLDNITKIYQTKEMKVEALKGISLAFRKNEFVSILGPSGCGKTTTLNIIGGLDHYTNGDLLIDGRSTKKFKDHDWDVYRNHKIGFVFQSYNLIPHENILENVELALTISGVSKEERVKLAKEALDKVGLKDMYSKKPSELSGGQCQRVAIARALVNKPDILLADEPTGALDSKTSVQIMDLIKEISKDKLVIMVTHNPTLAEKYSTRIINLLDGKVVGDTNPYSLEEEEKERGEAVNEEEKEKAKMSWWTAFKLSAKNLLSKAKRTSLIVVASSIGIVGVSAVLAVSQGVSGYITNMQDDMLSGYPIEVSENALDLSSLLSSTTSGQQGEIVRHSWKDGKIDVQIITESLIKASSTMNNATLKNDINEDYVQFVKDMPTDYYAALGMEYGFDLKNNLYVHSDIRLDGYDDDELANQRYSITGITAVCATILENINGGEYASYSSMVDSYTNAVNEALPNEDYVLSQYDVVKGKYATGENELMIVLNHQNQLTEFVLTLLGYYGQDEFANAIYHFSKQEDKMDKELWEKQQSFTKDDLLNQEYYYYPNDSIYQKNSSYNDPNMANNPLALQAYNYSFVDKGDLANGTKMKVVGILAPKEDMQYGSMSSGLYFTQAFADKYVKDNLNSSVASFVKDYVSKNENASGFPSAVVNYNGAEFFSGIGFMYDVNFPDGLHSQDVETYQGTGLIGSSSSLASLLGGMMGGTSSGETKLSKSAILSVREAGGNDIPGVIKIYPNNFKDKYKVTDYLDQWVEDGNITLSTGKTLAKADRTEIKYTDDISLIIAMINGVVNIVTIALICFTSLSLVVSTVMIGIITYVSVMERIKEIGVIRSLGGRKKDVSHLFNAETLIIGAFSGIFGLVVTYIVEIILNLTIGVKYSLGMIANLNWYSALIILLISILLTMAAGIIPAKAAARQDPVDALRSE